MLELDIGLIFEKLDFSWKIRKNIEKCPIYEIIIKRKMKKKKKRD